MTPVYTDEQVTVYHGDCLNSLRELPDNSIDAVVTDPPYNLTANKRGGSGEASINLDNPAGRARIGTGGFMGHAWDDNGGPREFQAWCRDWATECARVLKPGGYLFAFGGTRTYHRLAAGIEDAGLEIRDTLAWVHGQGFPKGLDVSKAIDKAAGAERELTRAGTVQRGGLYENWDTGSSESRPRYDAPATDDAKTWQGWGTALKPAFEPIVVARKPLIGTVVDNVLTWGTGALNIDANRIPTNGQRVGGGAAGSSGFVDGYEPGDGFAVSGKGRWPTNLLLSHDPRCVRVGTRTIPGDPRPGGDGTRDGGFAGTNGVTDGNGRPAGDLYGPETIPTYECVPGCPVAAVDAHSGERSGGGVVTGRQTSRTGESGIYGEYGPSEFPGYPDTGGASRFFPILDPDPPFQYAPKAPTWERPVHDKDGDRVVHVTVKPLAVMEWLIRLVATPDCVVLDPFAGSGTTLEAAINLGIQAVGIEREADYLPLIRQRITRAHNRHAPGHTFGHWDESVPAPPKADTGQLGFFD